MIELFERDGHTTGRNSSKGNQLKWEKNGVWYKADCNGYEGLAEYAVSQLMQFSNLTRDEFALYGTEQIRYKDRIYRGAQSRNFLEPGWQIITLERLFMNFCGQSLNGILWRMPGCAERLNYMASQTERITGLRDFGIYLERLLTIDAFFLNEDRHTHNIAVLMNGESDFRLCPVFDNGAALLSDTSMDYPMDGDVYALMETVKAKTAATDFDEQLETAETIFGSHLRFRFTHNDVEKILGGADGYTDAEKQRVRAVIFEQMRKYAYLFE